MRYHIQKITLARTLKGWSKSRLARMAQVYPATITQIEQGKHKNVETIKKIADVLGLTMEELVIVETQSGSTSQSSTSVPVAAMTKREFSTKSQKVS